jgi:hypothetical protein
MSDVLLPFGDSSVATVHSTGIVDIRVNSDREQCTLTSRMQVSEFARIAKTVFMDVRNDASNDQAERDLADDVNGKLMNFVQEWSD